MAADSWGYGRAPSPYLKNMKPPPRLEPTSTLEFVASGHCRFMDDDLVRCCGRTGYPYCPDHRQYVGLKPTPVARVVPKKLSIGTGVSNSLIDEL